MRMTVLGAVLQLLLLVRESFGGEQAGTTVMGIEERKMCANEYDEHFGKGSCDRLISSGAATCTGSFAPGKRYSGNCDKTW